MDFTKTVVNNRLLSLAGINHSQDRIEVHPHFNTLDPKHQDFILTHLKFRYEMKPTGSTELNDTLERKIEADKKALEEMLKKYPETTLDYWNEAFKKILTSGFTNPDDWKRLENIDNIKP